MKKTPNNRKQIQQQQLKRVHRVSVLLNERELRALNSYCDRYTVTNRSRLIRETLIQNILRRFEADQPTLFD